MEFLLDNVGFLAIILLFVFMVLTIPVFIAMGLSAFLAALLVDDPFQTFRSFIQISWQGASIFELVAIPLFIYTGTIMQRSGAGGDLFEFTKSWVGSIPNSLGLATIAACGIFSAISGSSIACAATVGLVAIPLLLKEGYSESQAGGFVAGGGTLGIIIPPSIPLILYGVLTETSIGQLFIAGVVPGTLILTLFGLYVLISRPTVRVTRNVSVSERIAITKKTIGIILLAPAIIIAIYTGIFTPTEVGALAVVYVASLGFIQKRLTWEKLRDATLAAVETSCMLFMLIVFGQYFAHFLTFEQMPQIIAQSIIDNASGFMALNLMILTYLVMGMFLESAAMLLISIPIFFPVAMQIGMDPLVFGIFAVIAMEIAQISPPVGINLFTIYGISKIRLARIALGAAPFLLVQVSMLYVVYFLPDLVTWLPSSMK